MGWNKWRQDWEIFGGCREDNETLRECIMRECSEELGLTNVDFQYLGLMYYKMAPDILILSGIMNMADCMELYYPQNILKS